MNSYEDIRKKLDGVKIIDAQECINTDIKYDLENKDIFSMYTMHYLFNDLVSAGMVNESVINSITDPKVPAETRYKIAKPFYNACFNTGHVRALKRALKDLHGIDDLSIDNLPLLQEQMLKCRDSEYIYDVLHNKCNIETVLLDVTNSDDSCQYDKRIFKRVWKPEKYIKPGPVSGEVIKWVERHYTKINSLDDWIAALDEEITDKISHGVNIFKISLKNSRSLYFKDVSYKKAKKEFDAILNRWKEEGSGERDHIEFPQKVQDFVLHRVLSSLRGRDVVVQFETGMQHDNRNIIDNAKPTHLNNLFEHYEDVKFDILGIGWPWWRELVALAKMYPNVFINFAGSHLTSPVACINCLTEAIDTIPLNKIIGFGGDYLFVDGVYGQVEIAKDNIARALSLLVDYGSIDKDKAVNIAETILYKNPKRLYFLK